MFIADTFGAACSLDDSHTLGPPGRGDASSGYFDAFSR